MVIGDCDPQYAGLRYLARRFELNMEQRFWLAFLYSASYCLPTTFFVYNEFPDFENVDVDRMDRWWFKYKSKLLFQTDRRWIKQNDAFVKMVASYIAFMDGASRRFPKQEGSLCNQAVNGSQSNFFFGNAQKGSDPYYNYQRLYLASSNLYYFGQYSLFLFLEAIQKLTDLPIRPNTIDLVEAHSCRQGLYYILGWDYLVNKSGAAKKEVLQKELKWVLKRYLTNLMEILVKKYPSLDVNYWNIETVLCGFKKLFWESRYLTYYIDRLQSEIQNMESGIREGVDWSVLWDFRREYFDNSLLGELRGRLAAFDKAKLYYLTRQGKLDDFKGLPVVKDDILRRT
jgi:hypothetical protein